MNNDDLFADETPMVEGSVEPHASSAPAAEGSPFQAQEGFGGSNGGFGFGAAQGGFGNDFAAPQQQGFGDDFAAPQQQGFGSGTGAGDFGAPQEEFGSPAAPAVQSAKQSPLAAQQPTAANDGFFEAAVVNSPPAVASPTAVASPVAVASPLAANIVTSPTPNTPAPAIVSPNGSQRNMTSLGSTSNASQGSSSTLPTAAPSQAFLERGKAKLDAQRRAVQDRTVAIDAATRTKEQDIQRKATEFLSELAKKRAVAIATTKADHIKEQQQYEAKMSQFKKSGAVWNSVNLLIDTKKPNHYSKNTEQMRKLLSELHNE